MLLVKSLVCDQWISLICHCTLKIACVHFIVIIIQNNFTTKHTINSHSLDVEIMRYLVIIYLFLVYSLSFVFKYQS